MAVLTASGALALAAPGQAQAAGPSCAGRKVKTLTFSTGSVHVYKRRGWVCAVTVPKRPGRGQYMMVSVQARGLRPAQEEGLFSRFAGPRETHAGGRCVRVKGAVGRGSAGSGWILC
jgi:hypothetical protein